MKRKNVLFIHGQWGPEKEKKNDTKQEKGEKGHVTHPKNPGWAGVKPRKEHQKEAIQKG